MEVDVQYITKIYIDLNMGQCKKTQRYKKEQKKEKISGIVTKLSCNKVFFRKIY